MKKIVLDFARLFIGYFICAFGVAMTINAKIGVAPRDVLHQGISNVSGITIGKVTIILGFFIIIIDALLGENIGWGTLFNMIFFGTFLDIILLNNLVPIFDSFLPSLFMVLLGTFILGYGVYIYMGAGYGSGPWDGLMVALNKKTKKSVRFVKNTTELLALIIGYVLGGSVGVGTAVMAIAGGYLYQFAFKTVNFDVSEVEHRYIKDDIKFIKSKIQAMLEEKKLRDEKN